MNKYYILINSILWAINTNTPQNNPQVHRDLKNDPKNADKKAAVDVIGEDRAASLPETASSINLQILVLVLVIYY